jgi:hypothetical protein
MASQASDSVGMAEILQALRSIQENQSQLSSGLASVSQRLDKISPESKEDGTKSGGLLGASPLPVPVSPTTSPLPADRENAAVHAQKSGFTSRIILT